MSPVARAEAERKLRLSQRLNDEARLHWKIGDELLEEAKRLLAEAVALHDGETPPARPRTVLRDMRH